VAKMFFECHRFTDFFCKKFIGVVSFIAQGVAAGLMMCRAFSPESKNSPPNFLLQCKLVLKLSAVNSQP
jgi:hypothetical protein